MTRAHLACPFPLPLTPLTLLTLLLLLLLLILTRPPHSSSSPVSPSSSPSSPSSSRSSPSCSFSSTSFRARMQDDLGSWEPLWAILERSWAVLRPLGRHVGASSRLPGGLLGTPEGRLGPSGSLQRTPQRRGKATARSTHVFLRMSRAESSFCTKREKTVITRHFDFSRMSRAKSVFLTFGVREKALPTYRFFEDVSSETAVLRGIRHCAPPCSPV